jgi:hypothetical protein
MSSESLDDEAQGGLAAAAESTEKPAFSCNDFLEEVSIPFEGIAVPLASGAGSPCKRCRFPSHTMALPLASDRASLANDPLPLECASASPCKRSRFPLREVALPLANGRVPLASDAASPSKRSPILCKGPENAAIASANAKNRTPISLDIRKWRAYVASHAEATPES